jgi:hypothetical protein
MSTRTSRQSPPRTLGRRVQWLVDQFAQGSVRAAAELWGIQRLTLLRMMKGQTHSPRGRVLDQIAEGCGTTVDWLRTGKGPPPLPPGPEAFLSTPWRGRWRKLVEGLDLPDPITARVVALPGLMNRVFQVFVLEGHPLGAPIRGMGVVRRAEEFEYRAWVALVTGMIQTYGRERVRAKLEAEGLWLDLQFNPVAIWRYMQEGVVHRSEDDPVKQEWNEALRLAHEIHPRLPIQTRSLAAD